MTRLAAGVRGIVLIHEGHKYQKNKTVNDKIHWRCWRTDCRAPIATDVCLNQAGAPVHVLIEPGEHSHPVDFDLINDTMFSQRCKELISQDPSCSLRKVYDRVCTEFAQHGRQRQVPDYERVSLRNRICMAYWRLLINLLSVAGVGHIKRHKFRAHLRCDVAFTL